MIALRASTESEYVFYPSAQVLAAVAAAAAAALAAAVEAALDTLAPP